MKIEDIEILRKVFMNVLEQTAFMFAFPADKSEISGTERTKYLQAYITFSGHQTGLISITMPEDICTEIAANILGMEPEDEQVKEQGEDAILEMLNILCGQFLTAVEGEKPVFDLSVPMMSRLSYEDWTILKTQQNTAVTLIDRDPVLLHLAI